MEEIKINDIANDLLIINKKTIEKLFELENCVDCVSLYIFLYKTSKWQKTNIIKANDTYICKCLKWGKNKVTNVKRILKQNGLIKIIQKRKDGKVEGWYIELHYLVNTNVETEIQVQESNNLSEQELETATSCSQDTNAYITKYKCLYNKYKMLIEENNKIKILLKEESNKKFIPPTLDEIIKYCNSRGNNVIAKKFYDYYNENHWKDSNGKSIKNWKLKVISWETNESNKNKKEINNYDRIERVRKLIESDGRKL